jgi:ABA responsive element binding factor
MEFKNCGSSSQRRPAVVVDEGAPLARQGSVYSLTFDEFQSALGGGAAAGGGIPKDFGSMNMDELLRSIWTAEETQAMASASGAGAGAGMPPTPLQRQGSSLTLPRTLSAKTVDEVWRNLVSDEPPQAQGADGGGHQQHHRQSTLGEMTLEEFLVRAGVVRENPAPAPPAPPPMMPPRPVPVAPKSSAFFGNLPGADDAAAAAALGFAPVGMGDLAMIPPRAAGMGGSAMAVQTAVNQQLDSGGKGYSDLSSPTEPLPFSFEGMIRGRRHDGGGVEKVVERRQRRMIKNRESAARSRARKQVSTFCTEFMHVLLIKPFVSERLQSCWAENKMLRKFYPNCFLRL